MRKNRWGWTQAIPKNLYNRMKTLGLLTHDFAGWNGGIDHFRMLLSALESVAGEKNLRLYILASPLHTGGHNGWFRRKWASLSRRCWRYSVLKKHGGPFPADSAVPQIVFNHRNLDAVARKFGIDCMGFLSTARPFKEREVPVLGFIYDCQHRHYPGFFTPEVIAKRDRQFKQVLETRRRIIVSSRSVRDDLVGFFGADPRKLCVMPFAPRLGKGFLDDHSESIGKFGLGRGRRYFVISNRFWMHKDHETAFKAFSRFFHSEAGKDFELVCTGEMIDDRNPAHVEKLKALIIDLKMEGKIRCLGFIDKIGQIEIMKHAVALVQPTLFEGTPGGLAVADAVSLGIPVIASDIPVNREISAGEVSFFKPGDVQDLAEKMESAARRRRQRPPRDELEAGSRANLRKLGNALYDACFEP